MKEIAWLLAECSIGTVAETAQARMHGTFLFVRAATDRPSTAGCWQTVQTYMPGWGKGRAYMTLNSSDSAHNLSVKFSLFMCRLAACSGSHPQCSTFSSNVANEAIYTISKVSEQLMYSVLQTEQDRWLFCVLSPCKSQTKQTLCTFVTDPDHKYTA